MKVYHVTSFATAEAIDLNGFQNGSGNYLTPNECTGVWISDRPLDENEGITLAEACFELEIDEGELRAFERIEDGKRYREWLVPAELLNRAPRRRLTNDELYESPWT